MRIAIIEKRIFDKFINAETGGFYLLLPTYIKVNIAESNNKQYYKINNIQSCINNALYKKLEKKSIYLLVKEEELICLN
jgi:hypothetical protein